MSVWTLSALLGDAFPWIVATIALVGVLVIVGRRHVVTTTVGPHGYRDVSTVSTWLPGRSTLALASGAWILATATVFVLLPGLRGAFVAGAVVQVWALLTLVHGLLRDEESVLVRAVVSSLVAVALALALVARALDDVARLDVAVRHGKSLALPLLALVHALACTRHASVRR